MRILFCFVFTTLLLNLSSLANDGKPEKIDAQKLLGKWRANEKKGTYPSVTEFRKDGSVTMAIRIKGEDYLLEGSYRINGRKVIIRLKDDIEHDEVYIIEKLTDTELNWTFEKSKEKEVLSRLKEK